MKLLGWFESFTQKQWTSEALDRYMGEVRDCYLTHASDGVFREKSNSGGSVTALLFHLLETGGIDGALVNESYIDDGLVKNRFVIAHDRESLLRAQGSKYMSVKFTSQAVRLIRAFEGRLAVVALPCDATILKNLCQKDQTIDKKVSLIITLFCGHNSRPELTSQYLKKWRQEKKELTAFQHKSGSWRGESSFEYSDGSMERMPFERFGTYQNLYFFCERKCLNCHDHFGYAGDLSAGDVWIESMADEEIKPTALIIRTERGEKVLQSCKDTGALAMKPITQETVMKGQARTARFHYQVSARHRVGKWVGLKVPDTVNAKVRLLDLLLALLVLLNYRFSTTKFGQKMIFALPRGVWKVYLYILKGLESL